MDTKKLYIKSQKNILNWGLGLATLFFGLSILSIFTKKDMSTHNSFDFWTNIIIYTVIFSAMIYTRFKINLRASQVSLFSYLALFTYYFVSMTIKAKSTYLTFEQINPSRATLLFIIAYVCTFLIMGGMSYLFYRVYKATKTIRSLTTSEATL